MKTKALLLYSSASVLTFTEANAAVIFSQNFDDGGAVADYVSAASPNTGQWNAISTAGANKEWAINGNALTLTSTGTNAAFASRTTDLTIVPQALKVSFSFELLSSSTNTTSAFQFILGSGFGTDNDAAVVDTHSKFGINFTDTGGFKVRDISNSSSGAATYTSGSSYQIAYYTNNTGSPMNYIAPDGSTETLADDTWDLWVGNSRQLNDRAVTTASQSITDFKFGALTNNSFSMKMDNLVIESIPEPSSIMLGALGMLKLMSRRRMHGA